MGQAEHGESGEVDGGGEQVEVGADAVQAARAGAAAAVAAAHEVGDFAFDFGAGGAVVCSSRRRGLARCAAGRGTGSGMQGGPVDEFLGVAVERAAFEHFEVARPIGQQLPRPTIGLDIAVMLQELFRLVSCGIA